MNRFLQYAFESLRGEREDGRHEKLLNAVLELCGGVDGGSRLKVVDGRKGDVARGDAFDPPVTLFDIARIWTQACTNDSHHL